MPKIIQIVMNDLTLVALCEDGSLWQLARNGTTWYCLPTPPIEHRTMREPGMLANTFQEQ